MALTGQAKIDYNFVKYRTEHQVKFWSKFIDGDVSDVTDISPEIVDAATSDKPFRSEGLTLKELWYLYIGVEKVSEEAEARGKKAADEPVEPIKARRIIGRQKSDKKGRATGEWEHDIHFHDNGYLHFDHWLFARDQARKDLLWLNINVLGNTKVTPYVHQTVCDQFIQKNFDGVYHKDYTLDEMQDAMKHQNRVPVRWNEETKSYVTKSEEDLADLDNFERFMILLDPRAFFKSTINRADAIQWLLNCPDMTMMIMTAANDLAETFVTEIKKKFFLARGAKPKALHLLFPEYVLRGVKGTSAEPLVCPAQRRERPYPTLWADSIDSTLSGWHCDIAKFDDVVSNVNCNTPITREKLKDQIDNTMNLVDSWGKIDMIGTRYFPDDYYGLRWDKYRENKEVAGMKFFCRAAWYVKPDFMHLMKKTGGIHELTEDMVYLTFPEHAPFKELKSKLVQSEKTFRCQQLNEPVWGDNFVITFSPVVLRSHLINPLELQQIPGEVFVIWDTAKEAKKSSDYSVGVAIKIYQKQNEQVAVGLLECIYGKWTQSEIAYNMAVFNNRWRPKVNQVEDTGGLELLKIEVQTRSSQLFGYRIPNMFWRRPDNEDNAKRNRIKALEILLTTDRLYFAVGPWLEAEDGVFAQLTAYTGQKSTRTKKDDIPDAMAHIVRYLPSSAPLTPKEMEDRAAREEQQYTTYLLQEHHKRLFGQSDNSFQLMPQQETLPESSSPYNNLAKKLFGSNGLRA